MHADLILHSGSVVTLAAGQAPVAEAVAVKGRRIIAVGDNATVRDLAGPRTRTVDLAGDSVIPGLNDSHLHAQWWGLARQAIDLSDVQTLEQVRTRVSERVDSLPRGSWVIGRGWHQSRLHGCDGEPTRALIDDISAEHPVLLEHFSAHGAWLNSAALQAAGIGAATPDPEGGEIVRDAHGEPTGMLKESALHLVQAAKGEPTAAERQDATVEALQELQRRGITSTTDPLVTPTMLRDYVQLRNDGRLACRVSTLLHWSWPAVTTPVSLVEDAMRYVGSTTGLGDDWLRIGGCKLMADGVAALGTSWMSPSHLHDGPCGSLVTEGDDDAEKVENLGRLIELLHRHRFQVQVHATGNRACDAVVEKFGQVMTSDPWDARHVLIHANHPSAASIETLARHGLIANLNSLVKWQVSESLRGKLVDSHWHRMMPMRDLLEAGVIVCDASDAPIASPDWPLALHSMVHRTVRGSLVSGPDQRVDRFDALRAWTTGPAYQDHAEGLKGSIEVGKLADLAVVDSDFVTMADDELADLKVRATVLDGALVYEA